MKTRRLPRTLWASCFFIVSTFIYIPSSNAVACSPTSTTYGSYTVLSFTTTGTCTWTAPDGITSADILLIGGGGGGGGGAFGGGGGAGGFVEKLGHTFTAGNTYTVSVGTGGTGGAASLDIVAQNNNGTNGGDTTIDSITAVGGGYGGGYDGRNSVQGQVGGNGGSGGGSSENNSSTSASTQTNYSGATTKGSVGGISARLVSGTKSGGGGGGAGGVGANANGASSLGGAGGAGFASSIRTGSAVTYAAGGNGGSYLATSNGTPGSANSGNGGSAGNWNGGPPHSTGGNGGSGILVIRYIPYSATTSSTQPHIWLGRYSIECPSANPGENERIQYANKVKPVIAPAENLVGINISQNTLDNIYEQGIYFDNSATEVKTATNVLPNYGCNDKLLTVKQNKAIQFIAGGFDLQAEARGYVRTPDGQWFDLTGVTLYTNTAAFLHTIQFKKPGQYLIVLAAHPDVELGKVPTYGFKNARFLVDVPKVKKKTTSKQTTTSDVKAQTSAATFRSVALVSPFETNENQFSIYLLLPLLLLFLFFFRRRELASIPESSFDPVIASIVEKMYLDLKYKIN